MKLPFSKYQGTGNDFVMIDQRQTHYLAKSNTALIKQLCDRRFGIGADGLILLENSSDTEGGQNADFEMIYFNADGSEGSMCGNGGRCLVGFAKALEVFENQCVFNAVDGLHEAKVRADNWVELKMIDVSAVETGKDYYLMNTGSPHFVVFVEDLSDIDVYENGREIRYSERFRTEGVNVNFVEIQKEGSGLTVATYERGVEAETYSCGTGVTAAAIAYALHKKKIETALKIPILTKGGNLEVHFSQNRASAEGNTEGVAFTNIWLCGPATPVFQGVIEI
jgi:diaminopimelate epimerase